MAPKTIVEHTTLTRSQLLAKLYLSDSHENGSRQHNYMPEEERIFVLLYQK